MRAGTAWIRAATSSTPSACEQGSRERSRYALAPCARMKSARLSV
jgi:hypothetical protein